MKMKAFITVAIIFTIAVSLRSVRIHPDKNIELTDFIPDTSLLYFEQRNGSNALAQSAASRSDNNLESIDYVGVAQEVGLQDDSIAVMKKYLDFYKTATEDPQFDAIFGKRLSFAVMQPVDAFAGTDIMEFLRGHVVAVVEPEYPLEWLEIAEKHYDKQTTELILQSLQYGNHLIKRVILKDELFFLVAIDRFFVISQNEKQLHLCIDTFDGKQPSLSNDRDFQEINKNIADPDRLVYVPMKTAREFFSSLFEAHSFPNKDVLLKDLQSTIGFTGFGYGAWRKHSQIEEKVLIHFEKSEINAFAKRYVETPQVESSMLSLVTDDPMIFYWSNTLNFKHFLMYIEDGARQDPRLAEFLTRLEAVTGKDAAETFALFGEEVSLIIEPAPADDLFPFPLGAFFIKVEKVDELKDTMEKLLQRYNLPMKKGEYGPAMYSYWSLSPQDGLLPLYGFWNNLFFFGNSSNLLHKVIDTKLSEYSLADIEEVQKIDPGLNRKGNSITYVNNIHLITMIKNFLEVLGTFVAIEDREIALKAGVVLKKIVNPLLDRAMMYNASVSRSHFTPDMLVIDSITDISGNTRSKE